MTAHPDIIPDVTQGREYGAPAEASSPGQRPSSRSRPDLGQNVPLQFSLSAADTAERVIGAIRDEVGTACDIIIGTHGQMTAAGALRIARRLEKFDPLWYEEPCPPENMKALAEVARRTTIPIATGERLTTKFDFARLIEHGAAAIFSRRGVQGSASNCARTW
jgi:L-alanine-DL-glutamate epimerase-like enolase superfamily enzyme